MIDDVKNLSRSSANQAGPITSHDPRVCSRCWSRSSTSRASTITHTKRSTPPSRNSLGCQPAEQGRSRTSFSGVHRADLSPGHQPTEQVRSHEEPTSSILWLVSRSSTGRASTITWYPRDQGTNVVVAVVSVVNRPSKYDHWKELLHATEEVTVSVVNRPSKHDRHVRSNRISIASRSSTNRANTIPAANCKQIFAPSELSRSSTDRASTIMRGHSVSVPIVN